MHPRYQEWLTYVFDHPVTDPQWYFELDSPEFAGSESDFALLISQTFLRSGEDLQRFSDAQVNQGIWFLASTAGSSFILSLRDGQVPLIEKVTGIKNIFCLYRDCFAARCSETLGYRDEPGALDLNRICYMFWDICPLTHLYLDDVANRPDLEDAVFSVLERTLQIEHRACREGALHGLGHMAYAYPERVRAVLEKFLAKAAIDDALRGYAENARAGNVL